MITPVDSNIAKESLANRDVLNLSHIKVVNDKVLVSVPVIRVPDGSTEEGTDVVFKEFTFNIFEMKNALMKIITKEV